MTDEQTSVRVEDRHPPTWRILQRFNLNLDALREMLDDLVPHLRELDEKRLGANALAAMRSLPEPRQEQLRELVSRGLEIAARRREKAESNGSPGISGSPTRGDADPDKRHVFLELEVAEVDRIFAGDRHLIGSFLEGAYRAANGPSRLTIIHNSLLAMAIGGFEVLVSGLVTHFYVQRPDALDASKAEFSLEDLRHFEEIEDAADALIARRVADLMRGSLADWAKWFETQCKADFADLAMDYDTVQEAFQRRHVVMHNGGRVSREYVARVRHGVEPPSVGTRLVVDGDYLRSVFDQLDVLGTNLAILAQGTWHPDTRDETANGLLQRSYQLMLADRWKAAHALCLLGDRLKCSAMTSLALKCNGWLSRAEDEGYESIYAEVQRWDTSALTGRFQLVQLVFLGELDKAIELVEELVQSKEITWGELQEWPVFRRLRAHEEFPALSAGLASALEQPESA